jgi:hypothetical protein
MIRANFHFGPEATEPGGIHPPGPRERPRCSERDLVVAVDQPGGFVLGRLRAAQEVDLLGDDFAALDEGVSMSLRMKIM